MTLGAYSPAAVMERFRSWRHLTISPMTMMESAKDLTHFDEPSTVMKQRSPPVCNHLDINADPSDRARAICARIIEITRPREYAVAVAELGHKYSAERLTYHADAVE
jgi:hypothetical protein